VDRLLLALFLAVNGLVLVNTVLHNPAVQYDAGNHRSYIQAVAQLHLPTPEESREFFSPPLPYLFPALWVAAGRLSVIWAEKLAQQVNVGLSLGLTFFLLKIADGLGPDTRRVKLTALLCLGTLPVYYRTFAYVRGEPYVAFFAVVSVYLALLVVRDRARRPLATASLGVALGLLAISRQWGLLVFPAIAFFIALAAAKRGREGIPLLGVLAASLALATAIGGWFYLTLYQRYGSVTAFNRERYPTFALANHPAHFYLDLSPRAIFTDPLRKEFPERLWPILYADTWGDYWQYFIVYGKDLRSGRYVSGSELAALVWNKPVPDWLETNRYTINRYLSRVNAVSLLPSALLVAGTLWGGFALWRSLITRAGPEAAALFFLVIVSSLAGYFWFVNVIPSPGKGDTIKAAYILQVFPFGALLVGQLLGRLGRRSQRAYWVALGALALVMSHNLPAMLTHYSVLW
jgi:hypothetical protein